jgi:hypothetical protein
MCVSFRHYIVFDRQTGMPAIYMLVHYLLRDPWYVLPSDLPLDSPATLRDTVFLASHDTCLCRESFLLSRIRSRMQGLTLVHFPAQLIMTYKHVLWDKGYSGGYSGMI